MRPAAFFAGASKRRFARLTGLAAAAAIAITLAACADDDDLSDSTASGSAFSQSLFKDYSDLAQQAEANPPADAQSDDGFFSFLDFGSSSDNPVQTLFTDKAQLASHGEEPAPEPAPGAIATGMRTRLVAAISASKEQFPDLAARAQSDYDCWVVYSAIPSQTKISGDCRNAFADSLVRLEASGRPAAPVPVASAPVAPLPSAPAPASDFTVYFDFDSWTLTAEDLSVLTQVINTARSGGQAHITVVGHTDTSGDDAYNQKLSVHRANVVVEALVDLGARRNAIKASGVGETDLAVQTPDGVKEAKNRRAIIGLQP